MLGGLISGARGLLGPVLGGGARAGATAGGGGLLGGLTSTLGQIPVVGGLASGLVRGVTSPLGLGIAGGAAGSAGANWLAGGDQQAGIPTSPTDLLGSLLGGGDVAPVGRPSLYTYVVAEYDNGAKIVRSRERGTPRVMSRDVQRMKKTVNTMRKIDERLPRKTVRESPMKQLQTALVQGAISNALNKS